MKIVFFQMTIEPEHAYYGDYSIRTLKITVRTKYDKFCYEEILHDDDSQSQLDRIIDSAKHALKEQFEKVNVNKTSRGLKREC